MKTTTNPEVEMPTRRVYQQMTTGKLHSRKNCSITARTRYSHAERSMTEVEMAEYPKCDKCWKV